MKITRRAGTFVALSLLALQSVVPLTRVAAWTEGQPPFSVPVPPPLQLAQARLLAALRSKIPIDPVGVQGDPFLVWHGNTTPRTPAGSVCGIRFERDQLHYRLSTFANTVAARTAEDRSGPVFKATAGRTRRNSRIHSSIPRPDHEIAPVVHDYVPDLAPK